MNLDDGSAFTAFRLRDSNGNAIGAGGSWRSTSGELDVFSVGNVRFMPLLQWTSSPTHISYSMQWRVQTPVGGYVLKVLINN